MFGLGAFSSRPPRGSADDNDSNKDYDAARVGFRSSVAGVGAGYQLKSDAKCLAAHQDPVGLDLYGPHASGESICGGTIARGLQGQFPHRFCLKGGCRFTSHAAKSSLGRLQLGAYNVKATDAHAYSELCLSAVAAALAPGELLSSRNNMFVCKWLDCFELKSTWEILFQPKHSEIASMIGIQKLSALMLLRN